MSGALDLEGDSQLGQIESRLTALETRIEYLATKADIAELSAQMTEKIAAVSVQIADRESSMQKWLIGILLAAISTVSLALVRLFF